ERTRTRLHDAEAENLQRRAKRSRPDLLKGSTRRVETPLGTMYVTITEDDKGQPFEVFISLGKAGGALMADVEAIGRLISLALRSGIPLRGCTASCAASRPIGSSASGRTKCCRFPMPSGSRSRNGCRRSRASSRICWAAQYHLVLLPSRRASPAPRGRRVSEGAPVPHRTSSVPAP